MKAKLSTIICLTLCLLLCSAAALAADHSATATIDLVFDGMTFTDTVQVEWNERYVVPEGGVKWDVSEEFIGYADKENWKIIDADRFSYVEGQIAFMAKRGTNFDTVEQLAAKYGARIVFYMKFTEDYVIELVDDKSFMNMEQIIAELKASNDLISSTVIPHYISYHTEDAIPTDNWNGATWDEENPSGENWGVESIRAVSAWDYSDFMEEMNVGIIDAGFDGDHNDISYFDIVRLGTQAASADGINHGTHVAGIVAATHNNKGTGISGVFPKGTVVGVTPMSASYYTGSIVLANRVVYWCDFKASMLACIFGNAPVMNRSLGLNYQDFFEDLGYSNVEECARAMYETYAASFANYMNPFFDVLEEEEKEFLLISSAGNASIDAYYNTEYFWITHEYFKNRNIVVASYGKTNEYSSFSNWGRIVENHIQLNQIKSRNILSKKKPENA